MWDMSDEADAALERKMDEGLGVPKAPESADEVRELQDRYGKENLIKWLSGTTDKSSRAWKSARDGLSRRRSGRMGVGPAWRNKFKSAGRRAKASGIRSRGSLHVSLTADIRTSRDWDRGRTMTADLSGDALNSYLEALEAGAIIDAAMIVVEEYGIPPEVVLEIDNISGFESDAAELDADDDFDEDE